MVAGLEAAELVQAIGDLEDGVEVAVDLVVGDGLAVVAMVIELPADGAEGADHGADGERRIDVGGEAGLDGGDGFDRLAGGDDLTTGEPGFEISGFDPEAGGDEADRVLARDERAEDGVAVTWGRIEMEGGGFHASSIRTSRRSVNGKVDGILKIVWVNMTV